jgi:serine kinase of HPr protein (carbohydrate metabolism regulator)
MAILSSELLHASTVAIDGHAVLITGLSGSGKSDLALRLIDRGAALISDDYTLITRDDGVLNATAPANIKGKIEVRGIGIVTITVAESARVALIVRLGEDVPRMRGIDEYQTLIGVEVPVFPLIAHEASAPLKVELALKAALAP